jgi:hypothetical protein
MDEDSEIQGGDVNPEEAMRQLMALRMQMGQSQFAAVARQMGMPDELLDMIEQQVVEMGGDSAAPSAGSGLLDASGRPLGGSGGGLVDLSGRPIGGGVSTNGTGDGYDAEGADDEDEAIELDEDASRQMFQELVGVRMIIGPDNFSTLAEQMAMPSEASEMVEMAAKQVEDEISARYTSQEEAMTVRLVNARMMMGQERFADFAGQVGMPPEVIEQVESIANQFESEDEVEEDEEDEDDGPSLA